MTNSIKQNSNLKKFPESIMKDLRERYGEGENDTSVDQKIMERPPREIFREICEWNGLIGMHSERILSWVQSIYGFTFEELERYK